MPEDVSELFTEENLNFLSTPAANVKKLPVTLEGAHGMVPDSPTVSEASDIIDDDSGALLVM